LLLRESVGIWNEKYNRYVTERFTSRL